MYPPGATVIGTPGCNTALAPLIRISSLQSRVALVRQNNPRPLSTLTRDAGSRKVSAILRAAAGSLARKPGPRSPACRSRARGHAPGTRTRARRLPLPALAAGVQHSVPEGRTVRMHRQFGALDPRELPPDRALARAQTRPLSTSKDSMRSDRRERVDLERKSFAPIACPPRRIRGRA